MHTAKRVVANTGILYIRMLLTVGISLYSTRLVLNALGTTDYGIYNLVVGVIAMLSFLSSAMATSTQRFISFYQGRNDFKMQKVVFSNSLFIHISLGIILVLALEAAGLFLFDSILNIPEGRVYTAKTIFHFMSISLFFTIVSVPFSGTLTAHENMLWVAIVNITEVLQKFGIAVMLYYISDDKLIFYGIAMPFVSIFSLLMYATYCLYKYKECTIKILPDISVGTMKELTSFAGWNLFGALCGVGKTQGIAIILNIFIGTVANAAYGISTQISTQMNVLSLTMLQALNPQIMKSEGSGDRQRMLSLSTVASKYGFILLAFIAIPSIFEMHNILKFWLNIVPPNTTIFCQLILIGIMINQLTVGLQSAVQATGKIALYQAVLGTLILLNIPVAYFLLDNQYPPPTVFTSFILIEAIALAFRLLFLNRIAELSIKRYLSDAIRPIIIPSILTSLTCLLIINLYNFHNRFFMTIMLSIIIFFLSIYIFSLNKREKQFIMDAKAKLLSKIYPKYVA